MLQERLHEQNCAVTEVPSWHSARVNMTSHAALFLTHTWMLKYIWGDNVLYTVWKPVSSITYITMAAEQSLG